MELDFLLLSVEVHQVSLPLGLELAHLVNILSADGNPVSFVLFDGHDHLLDLSLFILEVKFVHNLLHEFIFFDLSIFLHLLVVLLHFGRGILPLSEPLLV